VLEDYCILELTDERGYLAGKILADMGAEVIKIEPPGGDLGRRRGPFARGECDPEASLPWLAMNTSKQSLELDLETDNDRARFFALLRRADVLLETHGPSRMAALGLDPATLAGVNPWLVQCAITPFGSSGPYSGFRGDDLVVVAMGGNASMTGEPTGAPLRCSLPSSYLHAGPEAVVGILTAIYARQQNSFDLYVDVSMQECQLATTMAGPGTWALGKGVAKRSGARIGRTREIWRARDGWISFGLRGGPARAKNLVAITQYMREADLLPDWLAAYDWNTYDHMALDNEELARLEHAFATFFATKTMRELYGESLQRRILLAPCNDAAEILDHEQLRARSFFTPVEYPELGLKFEQPDRFANVENGSVAIRSPAPRVGEQNALHTDVIEMPLPSCIGMGPPPPPDNRIFEDIKILEFGSGAAGPVASRYFADRGATVVRVESAKRPDFLRHLHMTKDAPHGLNGAPMFISLNANKKSIAVDMTKPEGLELARRLVAWADVINENFAPGVMEKWQLDAASIRALNPSAITVSGSLFGLTGPQRHYPGFGGQGSAIAGFNHLTGQADGEAHGPYGTITDSLAPRYSAALIAAALLRRLDREDHDEDSDEGSGHNTATGEQIDLSQIESGIYSLSEMIVRYSATGVGVGRNGNHHPSAAPHAIYPCAGEDRWLAIAVFDDTEWRALCRTADGADWARDAKFDSKAQRLEHEDELDRRIGEWTCGQEPYALMQRLQQAGVQAGVVQTFEDLLEDPQLAHREHFVRLEHRHLGPMVFERNGFRLESAGGTIESPGPDLGEHTDEVLADLLGMTQDQIDGLRSKEVLT
jgi:crotonobetainyl-CoA:carnitine CoA-transferase CaiB-like acyl-CoA transferase